MVRVYFSELAYLQLLLEVKKYCRIETGAILVGQKIRSDYYVFESLDSGINCKRSPSIFYRDNPYSEHLVDVVRAKYKQAYAIGFWHRHPGSFNQFSRDDMEANIDMARVLGGNIISGLVNICDGKVKLRFWQITLDDKYEEAEIVIDNCNFTNLISYKSISEIENQILNNEGYYVKEPSKNNSSILSNHNTGNTPETIHRDERKKRQCAFFTFFNKRFMRQDENNSINVQVNKPIDIQAKILNEIYDDLNKLLSQHIKCEKYRIDDPEQQDKVALNFYSLVNDKQCDVILYFENGTLMFALCEKIIKYEKEVLAKEIISILEDTDGRVIASI